MPQNCIVSVPQSAKNSNILLIAKEQKIFECVSLPLFKTSPQWYNTLKIAVQGGRTP